MASKAEQQQQRAEQEEHTVINSMVADTEREIWDEANGTDPLDLDGDTSLEQMGEGLEGEVLEAEGDEGDAEAAEEPGVLPGHTTQPLEAQEEQGEEDEVGEEPAELAAEQPQRDNRGALREERSRRRQAEDALEEIREQNRALSERFDTFLTQMATGRPQQQQPQPAAEPEPQPEPDIFLDPQGWKAWNQKEARRIAREETTATMSEFERRQTERSMQTVNQSFDEAANGPRGTEFMAAYNTLTRLPKNPQSSQLVTQILQSRDPVASTFEWWEQNGGPEFRARQFQELADQFGIELPDDFAPPIPSRRPDNSQRRGSAPPRQQFQPRHETRLPQPMRSLNAAPGSGGPQREVDARALDGSENAIFAYASARE